MHIKLLVIIVIIIFLGTIVQPIETADKYLCNDPPSWPKLSGTIGDNNWYTSNVSVTFNGTINYRIDGGNWIAYTVPFILTKNGVHLLEWTCDGNTSNVYSVIIKIDQTKPIINNFYTTRIGIFKWKFIADVSDNTSGINRVEFYSDSKFIGICTAPPYTIFWKGLYFLIRLKFFLTANWDILPKCTVYDNAGNVYYLPIPSK